jgi:hypothetical protein
MRGEPDIFAGLLYEGGGDRERVRIDQSLVSAQLRKRAHSMGRLGRKAVACERAIRFKMTITGVYPTWLKLVLLNSRSQGSVYHFKAALQDEHLCKTCDYGSFSSFCFASLSLFGDENRVAKRKLAKVSSVQYPATV